MFIIDYLVALGPSIMMPIVFFILALCFGVKIGNSFKAAMLIGIGFEGIGLVIGLLLNSLGPAATAMVERFGLQLTVIDVGWPVAATIAWSTPIVPFVVLGGVAINIAMLLMRFTKTVNIDIFNYWHFLLTGGVIYAATGSVVMGTGASLLTLIIVLFIADKTAPKVQECFDLKGVSFAHATSAVWAPVGIVVNKVIDVIPVINKIDMSADVIQKRFGVMGEPLALGTMLGIFLGLLAGFDIDNILQLAIKVAAVMVLLPKMISVLVDGLVIVSESAEKTLKAKFPDREFYIGLDTALLVGEPSTLSAGLLLIPAALALSIILPNNSVLPFMDLASLVFLIPMITPYCNKNIFRLFICGIVVLICVLYAGSNIATYYTEAGTMANVTMPDAVAKSSEINGLVGGATTPLGWLLIKLSILFN